MANTVIGESIVIDGEITGNEDLVVKGTVKGRIQLKESLFVEESGVVEAEIETQNVEVSGKVTGNIAAMDKVELKADMNILKRLWKAVLDDSKKGQGPKFIYNDQDLLIHSMRDNLDSKIDEVLIDDEQLHVRAQKYLQAVMPRSKVSLKIYTEYTPLFSRFNVEPQIDPDGR